MARSARRGGWGLFAAAAALGLLALGPAAGADEGSSGEEGTLFDAHVALKAVGESGAPKELVVSRLVRMGPDIVPRLLALSGKFQDRDHLEVISETLLRLKDPRLDEYLLGLVGGAPEVRVQTDAYLLLGRHGTAAAVPRMIRLMDGNHHRVKSSAERALVSVLSRNSSPATYKAVFEALAGRSGETRGRVLGCVADAGSPHGLDLLGEMLGSDPTLDIVIVSGIARMPLAGKSPAIVARLRGLLAREDRAIRRECALALGIFRDEEALEALIGLLAEGDRGVAGNALWSLRNTTGLKFAADAPRWGLWLEEEKAWWEGEGKEWLARLESEEPAEVMAAISKLSQRTLNRGLVVERLKLLAKSGSEFAKGAAAEALAYLGERERGSPAATAVADLRAPAPALAPKEPEEIASVTGPAAAGGGSGEEGGGSLLLVIGGAFILVLALRIRGVLTIDWFRRMLSREAA